MIQNIQLQANQRQENNYPIGLLYLLVVVFLSFNKTALSQTEIENRYFLKVYYTIGCSPGNGYVNVYYGLTSNYKTISGLYPGGTGTTPSPTSAYFDAGTYGSNNLSIYKFEGSVDCSSGGGSSNPFYYSKGTYTSTGSVSLTCCSGTPATFKCEVDDPIYLEGLTYSGDIVDNNAFKYSKYYNNGKAPILQIGYLAPNNIDYNWTTISSPSFYSGGGNISVNLFSALNNINYIYTKDFYFRVVKTLSDYTGTNATKTFGNIIGPYRFYDKPKISIAPTSSAIVCKNGSIIFNGAYDHFAANPNASLEVKLKTEDDTKWRTIPFTLTDGNLTLTYSDIAGAGNNAWLGQEIQIRPFKMFNGTKKVTGSFLQVVFLPTLDNLTISSNKPKCAGGNDGDIIVSFNEVPTVGCKKPDGTNIPILITIKQYTPDKISGETTEDYVITPTDTFYYYNGVTLSESLEFTGTRTIVINNNYIKSVHPESMFSLDYGYYKISAILNNGNANCSEANPVMQFDAPLPLATSASAVPIYTANGNTYHVKTGDNNAKIKVTFQGGTPPYEVRDSSISGQLIASYSSQGTYEIHINTNQSAETKQTFYLKDKFNCTGSASYEVTFYRPENISFYDISSTPVNCNQQDDSGTKDNGTISIKITGGIPNYTATLWENGIQTSHSPVVNSGVVQFYGTSSNPITARTYKIKVTDALNPGLAWESQGIPVGEPDPLLLSVTSTPPLCNYSEDGKLLITTTGGNGGYSYTVTKNGTSVTDFNKLSDGTYSITASDNKGCAKSTSETLTDPLPLRLKVTYSKPASCATVNNAKAVVELQNFKAANPADDIIFRKGSEILNIETSDYSTNPATLVLFGLAQTENSTITVHDDYCEAEDSVRIPIRTPQFTIQPIVTTAAPCTGKNAIITINALNNEGIVTSFTIDGSPAPDNVFSIQGKTIHNFSASDGTCTATISNFTVPVSDDSLRLAPVVDSDITSAWCKASNTGAFTINKVNGTGFGSLTFTLVGESQSKQNPLTATFDNLLPKTYTILATDESLCTDSKEVVIPVRPDSLQITATNTLAAACRESSPTGEITVSRTANNIQTGYGTVYYTIGGEPQTNPVFTKLTSGEYTVTATDLMNCKVSTNVEVGYNNNPVTLTIDSVFDQTCNEVKNARVYLKAHTATAGTPQDFTFTFNGNTSGWNNDTVSYKLNVAGSYSFVATDRDNCGASLDHTIQNLKRAPKPVLDVMAPTACANATNGALTVYNTPNSSVPQYKYSFGSNALYAPASTNRVTFKNLTRGYYTITAKDTLGCQDTTRFLVSVEADSVKIKRIDTQVATCIAAQNGMAKIVASSADPTQMTDKYTFSLNGSILKGDSVTYRNLAVNKTGNYTINIADRFGCKNNATFIIGVKTDTIRLFGRPSVNPSCPGYNDGIIAVRRTNGEDKYRYEVTSSSHNQAFYSSDTLVKAPGLADGIYAISVRDTNNCQASVANITITQPHGIQFVSASGNYIKHKSQPEGILQAKVWKGNSKYNYEWINQANGSVIKNGQATDTSIMKINSLYAGNYLLRVRDTANCFAGTNGWLEHGFTIAEPEKELTLTIKRWRNVSCFGFTDGEFELQASGGWGNQYKYGFDAEHLNVNNLFTGRAKENITMFASDTSGVIISIPVTIDQPNLLTATLASKADVTCYGEATGSATINIHGGNYPHYFVSADNTNWERGTIKHNLPMGNYTIYVKDSLECASSDVVTITEPPQIVRVSYKIDSTRCGFNNGSISAVLSGGVVPYRYQWYYGDTLLSSSINEATGLYSGTYRLVATDSYNCAREFAFNVSDITDLTIDTVITTPVTCWGYSDGKAAIRVSKGFPEYSITWQQSQTRGYSVNNLTAGAYSVEVVDKEKCRVYRDFTIATPVQIYLAQNTVANPLCKGRDDGSIAIEAAGDYHGFEYTWNTGKKSNAINNLAPGTYSVTVADDYNCSNTFNFAIQYQNLIKPSLGEDLTLCKGNSVRLVPGDYFSYKWGSTGGLQSADPYIVVDQPGGYNVEVKDNDGCVGHDTVTIAQSVTTMVGKLLVATYIEQNDTVMIFEASWPLPDSVKFEIEGCKVLQAGKYFREVVFADTGTYKIGLISYLNDCSDAIKKFVKAEPRSASPLKSTASRMIKSFKASPNPNNGLFNVEIVLKEPAPVMLRLANISTGIITDVRQYKGSDIYTITYNMNLTPGMYLLHLQVGNEVQTKTLIIQ